MSFFRHLTSLLTTLGSTLGSEQLQAKPMLWNIIDDDIDNNYGNDDNNAIAGAALLLILANICLGCKYKWVLFAKTLLIWSFSDICIRLIIWDDAGCYGWLHSTLIIWTDIFAWQEILVQPLLGQPLRPPHLCPPTQGPDAPWPLTFERNPIFERTKKYQKYCSAMFGCVENHTILE